MMRKLLVGAVTATFLGMAGSAAADGIYEGEGSVKDTMPVAPVAIWSGLYIGGTVGFGTGDTSDRLDIKAEGPFDFGDFGPGDDVEAFEAFLSNDYDMDGAVYGGFLGYNWQRGNAVFGVEAGLNGTDFDGHTKCWDGADCHRKLTYYATVTGRLGYAVNDLMFYGFGGVAWGDVETKARFPGGRTPEAPDGGEISWSFNHDKTQVGWTAGVGLEFALTERFVAGIEYAHVDLGEESYRAVLITDSSDNTAEFTNQVDVSFDLIKIRASYKLWDRSRQPLEPFK